MYLVDESAIAQDSSRALHNTGPAVLIHVCVEECVIHVGGERSVVSCGVCRVSCVVFTLEPCEGGVAIRGQSMTRKARPAQMAPRSWLRRCSSIVATRAAQANFALGALSRWSHSSTQFIRSGWRASCAHQS